MGHVQSGRLPTVEAGHKHAGDGLSIANWAYVQNVANPLRVKVIDYMFPGRPANVEPNAPWPANVELVPSNELEILDVLALNVN